MEQELILIGDRVLILPDSDESRTDTGLYLPAGVKEKEKVQAGTICRIGPGYPVPDPQDVALESWQTSESRPKYFPLQAQEGDYCIFLRNAGIEIEFETVKYIVVPHAAILAIVRKNIKKSSL